MYHFLSGYTARVAGTEKGMGSEPSATFSTCFGAPFMPRHPSVYAKMLGAKMAATGANCWLVNTGWTGGAYGTGARMKIAYTRAMVRAALGGGFSGLGVAKHPQLGPLLPARCPNVPSQVLHHPHPRQDQKDYGPTPRSLPPRTQA